MYRYIQKKQDYRKIWFKALPVSGGLFSWFFSQAMSLLLLSSQ